MSDSDDIDFPDLNPADIRLAAMNLLARREHSRNELCDKLRKRFHDRDLVEQEVQRLTDENLQSDERFAESYTRQRVNRGYGPARVKQDMRQRGLSDGDIQEAFRATEVDWFQRAEEVFRKKFGEPGAVDMKEKAKRARFMQYRGFSAEHYQHLLEH